MRTIRVQRTFRAPAEAVFDVLADHAGYVRFPGVRSARVVRAGAPEPNGLGAVREIDLGLSWFEEEITAFTRPTRMEYRIVRSRPPVDHEGGCLTFRPVAGGVEVVWTTTFHVRVPLASGLVTRIAARAMERGFAKVLAAVDALVTESR
jgi:uncharacterized protein YndB with AHSA1/START domain